MTPELKIYVDLEIETDSFVQLTLKMTSTIISSFVMLMLLT